MKTFQFYTKKSWFEKEKNITDTFYLFTRLASQNTASGVVLTLYNDNKLNFYYSTRDTINAMPGLYQEIDEEYIQNSLNDELKYLFITLFFEGINKCL